MVLLYLCLASACRISDYISIEANAARVYNLAALLRSDAPARQTEDWQDVYVRFLTDNYDDLTDDEDIAGVGFIDLDVNGAPEMILFYDSGSSMNVSVFGLDVNGDIYPDPSRFDGEEKINARLFEDFRLLEDPETGTHFFVVESSAATEDFERSELIIFTSADDGMLSPGRLLGKYRDADLVQGEDAGEIFTQSGVPITAEEYERGHRMFFSYFTDTEYEAAGTFIWEKTVYENGFTGFMEMVANSIKIYKPC